MFFHVLSIIRQGWDQGHIAFEVEDVETILKTALSNDAGLLGEVTEKKIENVGILKFVYFRDPEGNIVEIQSWKK